jgi:hypothetical protein
VAQLHAAHDRASSEIEEDSSKRFSSSPLNAEAKQQSLRCARTLFFILSPRVGRMGETADGIAVEESLPSYRDRKIKINVKSS